MKNLFVWIVLVSTSALGFAVAEPKEILASSSLMSSVCTSDALSA